jgi:hypothetical protein
MRTLGWRARLAIWLVVAIAVAATWSASTALVDCANGSSWAGAFYPPLCLPLAWWATKALLAELVLAPLVVAAIVSALTGQPLRRRLGLALTYAAIATLALFPATLCGGVACDRAPTPGSIVVVGPVGAALLALALLL